LVKHSQLFVSVKLRNTGHRSVSSCVLTAVCTGHRTLPIQASREHLYAVLHSLKRTVKGFEEHLNFAFGILKRPSSKCHLHLRVVHQGKDKALLHLAPHNRRFLKFMSTSCLFHFMQKLSTATWKWRWAWSGPLFFVSPFKTYQWKVRAPAGRQALLLLFFRWHTLVICLVASKLAVAVFVSLYFQTFWSDLIFSVISQNFRFMTEKN